MGVATLALSQAVKITEEIATEAKIFVRFKYFILSDFVLFTKFILIAIPDLRPEWLKISY